jgi:hypothetical protein
MAVRGPRLATGTGQELPARTGIDAGGIAAAPARAAKRFKSARDAKVAPCTSLVGAGLRARQHIRELL